jgi:ankyrin repeat protein
VDRDTFERSRTPLLVAAACGHEAAALLLVERGADVNARDSFGGATALVEAAKTGQVKLVAALLRRGAKPNARDRFDNMGALAAAAHKGHVGIVRRLLAAGAPSEARALIEACRYGRYAVAGLLLNAGHSPRRAWKGTTPLAAAASGGNVRLSQRILELGHYDARAVTDALGNAAHHGETRAVRFLCTRGAHIDERDRIGWTALMNAAWQGHLATTRALLRAGADPRVQDFEGNTAEAWARKGGHDDVARLLSRSLVVRARLSRARPRTRTRPTARRTAFGRKAGPGRGSTQSGRAR